MAPATAQALAMGLAAALATVPAWGQPGPIDDARRQAEILERQQRERLREAQERALPPSAPATGADTRGMEPGIPLPDVGPGCHRIEELRIEDAPRLPGATRAALVRDHTARCLAAADIQSLLALITKDYVDRGDITTRVYLPAQELGRGVLTLRVVEGRIERYRVEQDGRPAESLSVAGAFPQGPGGPLNLRDIEQGLEQINNLRSNMARVDLEPGAQPGESVVVVRNRAGRPVRLQVSYDNLGSPSTGRDNVAASLSLESVLGLNELVVLTRNQTILNGADRAEGTALLFSIPYGYWTASADRSRNDYQTGIVLPSGASVESTGTTDSWGLSLSRVVHRGQASRIAISGRLAAADSRNFLGGQLLGVSSRKLATFSLGASGFVQVGGGMVNGSLAYVRGLRAFGALEDLAGLPADFPHAQFGKFTFELGYRTRVQAGPLALQWNSQLAGQASRHTLYGSQQFLVGGPSTVRGSRVNALSGDDGLLWRNDLSWPWQAGPVRGSLYAGVDVGRVDSHAGGGGRTGSMTGFTIGVAGQYEGVGFEVFVSRAGHLPDFLRREGTLLGVRLSWTH